MNILISGGAKNGKSYYAQRLARSMAMGTGGEKLARPLYYIATMIPHDEEDQARIRRHVQERAGWGFTTLEQGADLMALLERDTGQENALREGKEAPAFRESEEAHAEAREAVAARESEEALAGAKKVAADLGRVLADPDGVFLLDSVTALLSNEMFRPDGSMDPQAPARVARDCTTFAKATGNTVFVSDYIYGDAERYDTMTEAYRQGLAMVDRELAKVCERVIEVSAGTIEDWKSPAASGPDAKRSAKSGGGRA